MCFGIVGRVVGVLDSDRHLIEVEVGGAHRRVNASLLDGDKRLGPGSYVLINIGMAMEIVDEADALAYRRLLEELEQASGNEVLSAG